MRSIIFVLPLFLLLLSCQSKQADLVIVNATVMTMDSTRPQAQALAVVNDRIAAVGADAEIRKWIGDQTQVIDAEGQFVMPGFIEGHGHFHGLGESLIRLNLLHTRSWQEVIDSVAAVAARTPAGKWIEGRGWHQEKWTVGVGENVQGYPLHDALSEVSPEHPVILYHASGHALFANARAMEAAGVSVETRAPRGGAILRDTRGAPIGVFEETAMDLVEQAYSRYRDSIPASQRWAEWQQAIEAAEKHCLSLGITSFQDAGSTFEEVDQYLKLANEGALDVRLWVMLRERPKDLAGKLRGFPITETSNHFFRCSAFKAYLDGALGSFGAWLLRPYRDKPGFIGQNVTPIEEIAQLADIAIDKNMQLCVHAIGDRANREMLDLYAQTFEQHPKKTDLRWRIEHAQHLHPDDIPRFAEEGIIASMQGIHCTSDAPFVEKRLGPERARRGAYPWRSLLDAGAHVANGTDTPVEEADPLPCLYASVTRRRTDNGMELYPEQAMTREEALYSYTLGNAWAAFEEDLKGSLEVGKLADIVILSENLLECPAEELLKAEVKYTIVGGAIKYSL